MRTSDFQGMTPDSQVHISCRSFQTFSSPFSIQAKLIRNPSTTLVMEAATRGLLDNGFICNGHKPFKRHPCKPGEFDGASDRRILEEFKQCPYGVFYQDEIASTHCKMCPLCQYVPPDKGPGKSPLECLTSTLILLLALEPVLAYRDTHVDIGLVVVRSAL